MTADNKPTGGLGKSADTNKPSILEDFWSSSTYEMDNSAPQSQISASSTSNLAADAQCSSGSNPSEFVNRGMFQLFISVTYEINTVRHLSVPFT